MYLLNIKLLSSFIIIITLLLILSQQQDIDKTKNQELPKYCLQKRTDEFNKYHTECNDLDELDEITKKPIEFCKQIQCEPVECDDDEKLVENVIGRGCCPACIKYKDEESDCEVGALLERCRNGLYCNPSTKKCDVPPSPAQCLIEYHNRRYVSNDKYFYIEGNKRQKYYKLQYRDDMLDLPDCDDETGQYQLKQCRQEKCFCVNPSDGKFIFGLSLKYDAENVTCKCAHHFHQLLVTGERGVEGCDRNDPNYENCLHDAIDRNNLDHYSQVHQKCDSTGNFETLQCINGTCFCVDEKTGQPTSNKAAMFGALQTLACFDEEKAKKLNTRESEANYQNGCEKLKLRSEALSLEFSRKGTELMNMIDVTCGLDGRFAVKQCIPSICMCVNPENAQLVGNHRYERSGGREAEMNCQCALQEVETGKYSQLACEPQMGTFNSWQCSREGRKCYCVDENGSSISSQDTVTCLDQFLKDEVTGLLKPEICQHMRQSLLRKAMTDDTYWVLRYTGEYWDIGELDQEPDNTYTCSTI